MHRVMKLGKLSPRHDKRTILFSSVVHDVLPGFPMALARDADVPDVTDMYANDNLGDCTIASLAHLEEVWTSYGRTRRLLTTAEVVSFYSLVSGYVPGDEHTDNGANMLDVLRYHRTFGIGDEHRKSSAFVKIDHTNVDHVKSAINLFGGVYVGVQLTTAEQPSGEWIGDTTYAPSWGGHCMSASRYDARGVTFRTWGRLQFADWHWWLASVDECYALLDPDWLHDGAAPNGLDVDKLNQLLAAL